MFTRFGAVEQAAAVSVDVSPKGDMAKTLVALNRTGGPDAQ